MRFMLSVLLLLSSCGNRDARNSIEGIYTRYGSSEFSRAWDTLIIMTYDAAGQTYLIRRTTGIERIAADGTLLPFELRNEEMTGNYDPASRQIYETKDGRVLTFRDDELLFGTATYKRIAK